MTLPSTWVPQLSKAHHQTPGPLLFGLVFLALLGASGCEQAGEMRACVSHGTCPAGMYDTQTFREGASAWTISASSSFYFRVLGRVPGTHPHDQVCPCEFRIPPTLCKYTSDRPALCLPALEYFKLTLAFARGSCAVVGLWGRKAVIKGMATQRFAACARERCRTLRLQGGLLLAGLLLVVASKQDDCVRHSMAAKIEQVG
jgi:hypothetical protein